MLLVLINKLINVYKASTWAYITSSITTIANSTSPSCGRPLNRPMLIIILLLLLYLNDWSFLYRHCHSFNAYSRISAHAVTFFPPISERNQSILFSFFNLKKRKSNQLSRKLCYWCSDDEQGDKGAKSWSSI